MRIESKKIGIFIIVTDKDFRGQKITTIYHKYTPVAQFKVENLGERRLAAVMLVEMGLCTQKIAGQICGFHRNTVFALLRMKRILGVDSLFTDNRGPNGPHKYIGNLRSHIKYLLRKYSDWTDQAIANKASQDFNVEVSRSAVARIRTEKDDLKKKPLTQSELIVMAHIIDTVDRKKFNDRQLELNFKFDKDVKEVVDSCSSESQFETNRKPDQQLLKHLEAGRPFCFAGSLINHLILNEINYNELMAPFGLDEKAVYQSQDILEVLFHSINLGIPSIEALKLFNANDLGILIGKSRAPDKETMRLRLSSMAEQKLSGEVIDQYARVLLNANYIDPEVFFIDGHFLPYYGFNVIAKGYYTVRRLAMPGNILYAITDLNGRVLFFITENNEIDFRPIINRSAEKLIEYGISRPILVFDRGGYGIHFFEKLNVHSDFVTWAKYIGEKSLSEIPEARYTVGMRFKDVRYLLYEEKRVVKESPQTAHREGRNIISSIELRLIVLWNLDTGKRIGIYTNNTNKPLYKIAYYMVNRWGESENVFKELMERFNLNYHPGYDIKELEKQPLIDNPDIELINKAIRILKKEIANCEKEILINEGKEARRKDKRRVVIIEKLQTEINQKKNDISGFELKRDELPEKISILDILKGKPMSQSDLEKKRLYDLMQFISYNGRERLAELFEECYDDQRDVKQVLDMITSRGGYIKLFGKTLFVVLDWIENKNHREAAEKFCQLINKKEITMRGELPFKLSFHISKFPINWQA